MLAATQFEYRFRYVVHALIFTACFSAFWTGQFFQFGHNTVWARAAEWMGRSGMNIAEAFRILLVIAIVFSLAAAALRWWAAAYLGSSVVQDRDMVANRVMANGPFRYLRNPLYLGTIFHTLAVSILMQPVAASCAVVLITVFQLRLIAREEPYLRQTLGPVYTEYCRQVPRLLPRLRTTLPPSSQKPHWGIGLLGEVYFVGVAISIIAFGWKYDASLIMQGILVALGVSIVARAFIPAKTAS